MLIWLFELIDRYCQDVKPRLLTTGPASLHNSLISVLKPTGIIMRIRLITKHSLHEEGGRCEPCPLPSMIQLEHFLLCSVHRCMQLSGRLRVGPGSQPVWGGGGGGGGGGRRHLRESERATLTSPAHRQSDGWASALSFFSHHYVWILQIFRY